MEIIDKYKFILTLSNETEEEARKGHEKYVNMSTDEIGRILWIG